MINMAIWTNKIALFHYQYFMLIMPLKWRAQCASIIIYLCENPLWHDFIMRNSCACVSAAIVTKVVYTLWYCILTLLDRGGIKTPLMVILIYIRLLIV